MSTQEPPRINPARLLREYILMHFSRDELVPDFEQQMDELEAYLNEPVFFDENNKRYSAQNTLTRNANPNTRNTP